MEKYVILEKNYFCSSISGLLLWAIVWDIVGELSQLFNGNRIILPLYYCKYELSTV